MPSHRFGALTNLLGNLFWDIEYWTDSIKYIKDEVGYAGDKERLERLLQYGLAMRVSKLSLIVGQAYEKLYTSSISEEWIEFHLDSEVKEQFDFR